MKIGVAQADAEVAATDLPQALSRIDAIFEENEQRWNERMQELEEKYEKVSNSEVREWRSGSRSVRLES